MKSTTFEQTTNKTWCPFQIHLSSALLLCCRCRLLHTCLFLSVCKMMNQWVNPIKSGVMTIARLKLAMVKSRCQWGSNLTVWKFGKSILTVNRSVRVKTCVSKRVGFLNQNLTYLEHLIVMHTIHTWMYKGFRPFFCFLKLLLFKIPEILFS